MQVVLPDGGLVATIFNDGATATGRCPGGNQGPALQPEDGEREMGAAVREASRQTGPEGARHRGDSRPSSRISRQGGRWPLSMQNQALNALLFLYRDLLRDPSPDLEEVVREPAGTPAGGAHPG